MTDERLTTLPLLVSIAVTGTVLAAVIAWQATGVPIVALLLVPWLLVMIALILPAVSAIGHETPGRSPVQRRTVAVGIATVAVAVAFTTAGDWTDAGDADQTAPAVLALAAESTVEANETCDVTTRATNSTWVR